MPVDKITPDDSRVSHRETVLNGQKYHYIHGVPKHGKFKATVFLIHGWPDLSYGWRYQIPFLIQQNMQVVVPDMMGYGRTDAPRSPPADLRLYSIKRAADDISELAKQLGAPKIILGGHDWGGIVVYRTAQWYPELVTHVFSVCTPYTAPSRRFISLAEMVHGPLPQFGYQMQLAGPELEANVTSCDQVRNFLRALYGGRSEQGKPYFRPETGIDLDGLETIGVAPSLDGEACSSEMNSQIVIDSRLQELEYYTREYMRHGLHGPLNWYRTRRINFEDDLKLGTKMVKQPVLFISGRHDAVLTPEMSKGMEAFVPRLTRREVEASHWALTQTPEEVNNIVKEWLREVALGSRSLL
ncbi:epoxide hydrolase [Aureobasidium namibiae CBS 147.97]|uniref:Epoxide hydrolase n=1 Tax=Aureobasidium namibiae CBS 147.97 TaxID=1043004 RepID=A0A074X8V9_9PEZI|nr:epoxide hydrolase [Aureobasidium namibiae CBS 147.97]KEQ71066.1 epoxide hydrolase [Aureobasidium namibiae CBS 147.97]